MSPDRQSRFAFLRTRRWFAITTVVAILVVGSTAREWYANYTTEREIHALEDQAKKLDSRRLELLALSGKVASGDSLEAQARLDFNLARPGESVVVVKNGAPSAPATSATTSSNPVRWWSYLVHGVRATR